MANSPQISIITVVKNDVEGLKQTLESVQNQGFRDVEHIIIDGASTDGTLEMIKANSSKLTYWVSEEDKGVYQAMNKGLKQASGDWIQFLNSGDRFHSDQSLKKMIPFLNDQFALVYCDVYLEDKDKSQRIRKHKPIKQWGLFNNICHQAAFYQREWLRFDFNEQYDISADFDMLLNLYREYGSRFYKKVDLVEVIYQTGGLSEIRSYDALEEREMQLETVENRWLRKWNQLNLKRQKLRFKWNDKRLE